MKKTNLKIILWVASLLVVYGCYKEDVSELYSRQYIVTFKKAVDDIQKDIDDLRDLYNSLNNKPIATNVEYERDPQGDIVAVKVTIDKKEFKIPYPKTPKPATISISGDGFWVINGVKTTTPVNIKGDKGDKGDKGEDGTDGQDGKDGQSPIVGVKLDTDGNYYWTIQMPNETTPKWLTDAKGNKVKANGDKGDKGDKGEDGQPGTQSFVTNIEEKDNPDGTKSLLIHTRDNKVYTIPLTQTEIALKLVLDQMKSTNPVLGTNATSIMLNATGVLFFDDINQSVTIPYQEKNVTNIVLNAPTGWTINKNLTDKTITLIAPSMSKAISSSTSMEGELIVFGLDEKGKSVSQSLKIALKRKIYYSYFYYPLRVIETDRPNSPSNSLSLEGISPTFIQSFYRIKQGSSVYEHIGNADDAVVSASLGQLKTKDPNFAIDKKAEYIDKSFSILSAIYDKKYTDYVQLNIGADGQPKSRALAVKELPTEIVVPEMANQKQRLVKPVHYNTYMTLHPFRVNETLNNEIIRLRRVASKVIVSIPVDTYKTIMGITGDIDLDKVGFQLTNSNQFVTSEFNRYNRVTTDVKKEYDGVTLEIKDNNLHCEFAVFGTSDNNFRLYLLYDNQKKKKWQRINYVNIDPIHRDYVVTIRITNGVFEDFTGGNSMKDYIGIHSAEESTQTAYKNGELVNP